MFKRQTEYQKLREENKKESSKKRLKEIAQQKIRTTMIGALATMEDKFGFLREESDEMRELFDAARSEILDKGNTQIRNIEVELANYDIVWNKYTMILPVKRKE